MELAWDFGFAIRIWTLGRLGRVKGHINIGISVLLMGSQLFNLPLGKAFLYLSPGTPCQQYPRLI